VLTPAELAAAMRVSTRTVARWDKDGCPCEWAGTRRRYDLAAVQAWNRERQPCQPAKTPMVDGMQRYASAANAFTAASRKVQLRVMPSSSKPN
jgi:phage terminase Nu1 subunit (DNA packaging protein)